MLMRLDCVEAYLRREQNRREKASVRRSADCVLLSIDQSIEFLRGQRKSLRKLIDSFIESSPTLSENVACLRTIHAVGEKTANRMAAVLGANTFVSAKEAAAFLGLVPESGVSVKGRAHLPRAGNPRVRASLYMAAVVAKKVNPEIKALYERLSAQGKPKMSALGACMRKLVHLCFGYLSLARTMRRPRSGTLQALDFQDGIYVRMHKGWMYLCSVLDWYSRKVLAWRLSNTMDVDFCVQALYKSRLPAGTLLRS